jgi:hypothetical protein
MVIADFESASAVDASRKAFERLARAEEPSDFPDAALWQELQEIGSLTVETCSVTGQLHVTMSADEEFFLEGARPAVAIRRMCDALGGTTHWRDRE